MFVCDSSVMFHHDFFLSHWNDIVGIAAGKNHVVGLKADGTVVAGGNDENGQCNVSDWRDIGKGLCKYCGGKLGGMFTKKCKNCGREN